MTMKRPNSTSNQASSGGSKFNSYQQGGSAATSGAGGYQPPVFYAADQTKTIEDTTKTFYQADETSGHVLNQLMAQRQQITGAHDNAMQMQQTTAKAQVEMEELRVKYRKKKQRLYMWIAVLSVVDTMLFFRILQCHGNFYCFY